MAVQPGPGAGAHCPPPVTAPVQQVIRDFYHPAPFPVVHPIEIVNRHHIVPVPYHVTQCTVREEMATVCSAKKRKRRK